MDESGAEIFVHPLEASEAKSRLAQLAVSKSSNKSTISVESQFDDAENKAYQDESYSEDDTVEDGLNDEFRFDL